MKAVALTRYLPVTDSDCLLDVDLPAPQPAGRDLLVRVKAVSVNPVDTKVRAPKDKIEQTPKILGWDAAGIVEAVGNEVSLFQPGDEVYYAGDITRPGSNAELQLVDERIVGKKPKSLSFAEAAALPLTAITAWESLFDRLGLDWNSDHSGTVLLIIGGAGGVGSIGIQLAKLAGLTVIATASRPDTESWVRELGADHVINHHSSLPEQIRALGIKNVPCIANFSNTDLHWQGMAEIVSPQGKIVGIVENSGPLELGLLKSKSAGFIWEFMFTRSLYQTNDMGEQGRLLNQVADLIDQGKLRTTLKQVLSPINAANLIKAHALLESGKTIGKVVLSDWDAA